MAKFKEVEISTRVDGRLAVWAYMGDPQFDAEYVQNMQKHYGIDLRRWVLIDVLDNLDCADKYYSDGVDVKLMPAKAA